MQNYRVLALIVLNTTIVLLVLNLLASGIIDFQNYLRKKGDTGKTRYSFKKYEDPLKEIFPDLDKKDIEKLLDETRHLSLGFDIYTQFKERPFVGQFVNADIRGFRPIRNQGPWPPDPRYVNVFVFGGSTTFGYGVPDNETIPSYLQEVLNSKSQEKIRVYNLGRGGYISVQERILLEKLILDGVVPQVAIFIDGLNDLGHCDDPPAFTTELTKFMDEGEKSPIKNCVMQMPILKLTFNIQKNITKPKGLDSKRKITNAIRRYEINREIIQSIANYFKIEPLFVWQPVPVYGGDHVYNIFGAFDYDGYMPCLRIGYEDMARDVANKHKFGENFLWLGDMQIGLSKSLYVDAIHYSPYLCRIIAEKIGENLEASKIIEKAKARSNVP